MKKRKFPIVNYKWLFYYRTFTKIMPIFNRGIALFIMLLLLFGACYVLNVYKNTKRSIETLTDQAEFHFYCLLNQYDAAYQVSDLMHKAGDNDFYNKLLRVKDSFPSVLEIINKSKGGNEKYFSDGAHLYFMVGNRRWVKIKQKEVIDFVLKEVKGDHWFKIALVNDKAHPVHYVGPNSKRLLFGKLISKLYYMVLLLFLFVFWSLSNFYTKILCCLTQQLHDTKRRLEKTNICLTRETTLNKYLCVYSHSIQEWMYALFNTSLMNNTHIFDKCKSVDVAILLKKLRLFLEPICIQKKIHLLIEASINVQIELLSEDLVLLLILNYVYLALERSSKNNQVKVLLLVSERMKIQLKIIDHGYAFFEPKIIPPKDIFCLSQEMLYLLSKKLNIEVITCAESGCNVTIFEFNQFYADNIIPLFK